MTSLVIWCAIYSSISGVEIENCYNTQGQCHEAYPEYYECAKCVETDSYTDCPGFVSVSYD